MDHFIGLDVSVKETSVCVVDAAGVVVLETKVPSEPEALAELMSRLAGRIKRVGLEAGPLSQWLHGELVEAGYPMICVDTRHMRAALAAQVNKSDRNDARGIAQMMRVGLYRPVHVKTVPSQKRRMLLTSRQLLQAKARDIENDLRSTLRNFGLKVGMVSAGRFAARIRELVEGDADLTSIVEPLLAVHVVLREQIANLHRQLLKIVRQDAVCRLLMTMPGVGPVVALTYRSTVDSPARFARSKAVGAVIGLTPRRHQSGETDRMGGITRCGDAMLRGVLFEAAQSLLTRVVKWSWLKAWGIRIAQRRGMKRAVVATARRMAVVLHRMWATGTEFRWTRVSTTA